MTTLTVLPLRPGRIDRAGATVAMCLAPLVGVGLGALCSAVAIGLRAYGMAPLAVAVVVVTLLGLLTRALHLDGLADTADALGSYAEKQRALSIMKAPDIGPMGVFALLGVGLADTAALTSLIADRSWVALTLGVAMGRAVITGYCCRPIPAARPDGLGAMVAQTVPVGIALGWFALIATVSWASTARGWTGPVAILFALLAAAALLRQVLRRLGGITGDVLGAGCELSTAVALVLLSVN